MSKRVREKKREAEREQEREREREKERWRIDQSEATVMPRPTTTTRYITTTSDNEFHVSTTI